MPADRGDVCGIAGDRPAAQVRHLVDGQLLLAFAVAVEDALRTALGVPQIDQDEAVLAEKTSEIVATIIGHQAVIGLPTHISEFVDLWMCRIG